MIVERKKDNESNESLIRRFTRKVQGTGVLTFTKSRQFFMKKPNRRQRRIRAIRGKFLREEREHLIKIGKLPEQTANTRYRSRS